MNFISGKLNYRTEYFFMGSELSLRFKDARIGKEYEGWRLYTSADESFMFRFNFRDTHYTDLNKLDKKYALVRFGFTKADSNFNSLTLESLMPFYKDFFQKVFILLKNDVLGTGDYIIQEFDMRASGYGSYAQIDWLTQDISGGTDQVVIKILSSVFFEDRLVIIRDMNGQIICALNKFGFISPEQTITPSYAWNLNHPKVMFKDFNDPRGKYVEWRRKWKEIKQSTGIIVPYPFNSIINPLGASLRSKISAIDFERYLTRFALFNFY